MEEEGKLLAAIDPLVFNEVRMRGVVAKRTVIHYGWNYRYDEWKIEPTEPILPFLEPLRARVAHRLALPPVDLAEVLVSRYPATAGIGWHRDAPMFGRQSRVSHWEIAASCVSAGKRAKVSRHGPRSSSRDRSTFSPALLDRSGSTPSRTLPH